MSRQSTGETLQTSKFRGNINSWNTTLHFREKKSISNLMSWEHRCPCVFGSQLRTILEMEFLVGISVIIATTRKLKESRKKFLILSPNIVYRYDIKPVDPVLNPYFLYSFRKKIKEKILGRADVSDLSHGRQPEGESSCPRMCWFSDWRLY